MDSPKSELMEVRRGMAGEGAQTVYIGDKATVLAHTRHKRSKFGAEVRDLAPVSHHEQAKGRDEGPSATRHPWCCSVERDMPNASYGSGALRESATPQGVACKQTAETVEAWPAGAQECT
jgi:hypothetical protein